MVSLFLASLLANISFKLQGLLIGYLVVRYYDLIILGLPFVLNIFPLETGIPFIIISMVLAGVFCILAFIVSFKGDAFFSFIIWGGLDSNMFGYLPFLT